MRMSKTIEDAINAASHKYGSRSELCRVCSVPAPTVTRYMTGHIKNIDDDVWGKLYPHISHYLPSGPDGLPLSEYRPASWWQQNREWPPTGPGILSANPPSGRTCRIYGLANCASSPIVWGDVAPDGEDHLEQVQIPDGIRCSGRISAFRAVDTSMEPTINDGDVLFFSPDVELSNNNVALVKYDGDKVVCKRWMRDGDTVVLTSDAPGIQPIILSGRRIEWAYRILMATRTREL